MALRTILFAITLLGLVSASPAPHSIVHPLYAGQRLIIPAGTSATFEGWDKSTWEAHFDGRIQITGTLVYDCNIECPPEHKNEGQVYALIIPDRAVATTLPHWDHFKGAMAIYLTGDAPLVERVLSHKERAAVLAGRSPGVRRRVSIVVDQFKASIECESAVYSARFVAIAEPPPRTNTKPDELTGCGF